MKEIFHRASVRKYTDQEVEEEKIDKLLDAAMASPSAKNQRAWEFFVIRNKSILQKLSEATPYSMCVKNATVAIVVCYKKESIAKEYLNIDCAIATENILLEADHIGLGAVMIGVSPIKENKDNVERILNLDNTLSAFTIIPIGYPLKEKQQEDRFDKNKVHYIN